MRHVLASNVETRDWTSYRDASRRLESYRLGDFSPLDDALSETFKRTDSIVLVPVDVVSGACRDVGRLYDMPPSRSFDLPRQEQRDRLEAFYAKNDINGTLGDIDQSVHAQQVVVLGFDIPAPGKVRPVTWAPFEVEAVEFDDLMETDIRRARLVRLRVPISADGASVIYGTRVYTPDEAYIEMPNGQSRGIFSDDLSNPFGFVPLVARREAAAASKGEWFPPINEALLKLQEQVAISVADILKTCRHQCAIRKVVTGGPAGMPLKLSDGADVVWHFPAQDDNAPAYAEHADAPPTAEYWESLREMLALYERFAGLTPGALTSSTGITGAAKQVELESVTRRVRERMGRAARFEQDVLDLLLSIGAVPLIGADSVDCRVEYHVPRAAGNSLQDEQARAVRYALGLASPVSDVAEERGVPVAEAEAIVAANKKASSEHVDASTATAGLDKSVTAAMEDHAPDGNGD
jgi:hypothetical protein